jgi:hypothetical protein
MMQEQHDWVASTLGHGERMCRRCFITNREADALGAFTCDVPLPKVANENGQPEPDEHDDYQPFVCPVTCQPCTTEQDEFCEDYGCARKAGIDVDRDLII